MNQYKKLMSNTFIFAVGTFSSKLLVFIMMRFYTGILTQSEMGIADIINQTGNILMPLASIGITNAVIRFGLEKSNAKASVFTIGFTIILFGFALLIPFAPLIRQIKGMDDYVLLIYVYVLMANLQSLCGQFTRARGHVRLYALDGIFRTAVTVICNILFLAVFAWGIEGYVLSVIVANACSAFGLFLIDAHYRFLRLRAIKPRLAVQMLAYALPLIPTTICVWIFSMSDHYFILYQLGDAANGLYSVAYRIPTVLVLVSGIFIEAWQISTINNSPRVEQERFFTRVGNVYQAIVFMLASGIILTAKLGMLLLADESYYAAWAYIPLLAFGTAFACLSNFQNSIYTLEKKSIASFATAMLGASANLALNFFLIPIYGPNGAAFATLTSYVLMFMVRAIHTRRYLVVHWHYFRFALGFMLLAVQCVVMLLAPPLWIAAEILLFLSVTLLGGRDILSGVRKLLGRQ